MQAKLAVAEAATQEGAEKAGGALQEAEQQIEAALVRANGAEAECTQLRQQEQDLKATLVKAREAASAQESELQSESERRARLDLDLARCQEALSESRSMHQALQQQHVHTEVSLRATKVANSNAESSA